MQGGALRRKQGVHLLALALGLVMMTALAARAQGERVCRKGQGMEQGFTCWALAMMTALAARAQGEGACRKGQGMGRNS